MKNAAVCCMPRHFLYAAVCCIPRHICTLRCAVCRGIFECTGKRTDTDRFFQTEGTIFHTCAYNKISEVCGGVYVRDYAA